MSDPANRAGQLDRALTDLLTQAPEVEAAAVVSFDGLPMASALPAAMDEDRVAAMSAALLSLGERASEGLGRGALSQVYIEGEHGTVFLVSADDEAVLVAVAAKGAKVGMMLFEVRRAAAVVADALRAPDPSAAGDEDTVDGSYGADGFSNDDFTSSDFVSDSFATSADAAPDGPIESAPAAPVMPEPAAPIDPLVDPLPFVSAASAPFAGSPPEPLPAYSPTQPQSWS